LLESNVAGHHPHPGRAGPSRPAGRRGRQHENL